MMHQLNHHDYYVGRAEASRRLASRAINPKIAAIHCELAERYELTAEEMAADDPYADDQDG